MGVFKEEVYAIEQLANLQRRLYNDSCDFGVFLSSKQKEILRDAIQSLRSCCHTRPVERYNGETCDTTRTDVYVAWEADGPYYNGTHIVVESCKMKSGKKAGSTLFTINMGAKPMSVDLFKKSRILDRDFIFSSTGDM